jgi:hypothetical protein
MAHTIDGTALYIRQYSKKKHGTPKQLAKKFANYGCKWAAIAGPWHEKRPDSIHVSTGLMNSVDTCRALSDAFWEQDIDPFIWGYPWQGTEEKFADQMDACAGEYNLALLDPELGSNPTRSSKGPGKAKANAHATKLVGLMVERFVGGWCGLSTYGSGVRMSWFPLYAFAAALAKHFPGRTFMGGQTYTEDGAIDTSIADFMKAIKANGGLDVIQLVPNFGTYTREHGKVRSKKPEELRVHLYEFIDEAEPVHAMIGWAENFMNDALWAELKRFNALLERGACRL